VAVDHIVAEEARPEFGGLVEVDAAQIVASVVNRSDPRCEPYKYLKFFTS